MPVVRELITRFGYKANTGQLRRIDRQMEGLQGSIRDSMRTLQKHSQQIQEFGAKATKALTLPVTGMGIASAYTTAKFKRQQEVFKTLAKDTAEGNKAFRELFDLASRTHFDTNELVNFGRKLLGANVNAENLNDTMRKMINLSGANEQALDQVTEMYTEARQRGAIEVGQLDQLAAKGIPIMNSFEKVVGRTKTEFEEAGNTLIEFEKLDKIFDNLTSKGGRLEGLLSRITDSMSGRLNTFIGNLHKLSVQIGEDLAPVINGVLGLINKLFDWFMKMPKPLRTTIEVIVLLGAVIAPLIYFAGLALSYLPAISATIFGSLVPAVTSLAYAVASLMIALLPLLIKLGVIIAVGYAVVKVIQDISKWLTGQESIIGSLLGSWDSFTGKVKTVGKVIKDFLLTPFRLLYWTLRKVGSMLGFIDNFDVGFMDALTGKWMGTNAGKTMANTSGGTTQNNNKNVKVENNIEVNEAENRENTKLKMEQVMQDTFEKAGANL